MAKVQAGDGQSHQLSGDPNPQGTPIPRDLLGRLQAGLTSPYLVLHALHLGGGQSVSLGQNRHNVHPLVQGSHELHVQGPEPAGEGPQVSTVPPSLFPSTPHPENAGRGLPIPMAKGRDEVDAAVDAVVLDVFPVEATFVTEILLELLVNVVGHRLPAAGTGG